MAVSAGYPPKYKKMRDTLKARFHRSLSLSAHPPNRISEGVRVMYLKKVEGPRAITLPDGKVFSRADLPPPETARWVASRKLAVVRGVAYGLISRGEAMRIYGLSEEELDGWARAAQKKGIDGLKVTAGQGGKQP
jgi:hypothetical protein